MGVQQKLMIYHDLSKVDCLNPPLFCFLYRLNKFAKDPLKHDIMEVS
jgi:hypothetical protein